MTERPIHRWTKIKHGSQPTCAICRSRLIINWPGYACTECRMPIHRKCLLNTPVLPPCTGISLREISNTCLISGELEIPSLVLKTLGRRSTGGRSKSVWGYVALGILYLTKDDKAATPSHAIAISDFVSVEIIDSKLVLNKGNGEPLIIRLLDGDGITNWKKIIANIISQKFDIRSSSVDWFKVYSPQIAAWYNDLTITIAEGKNMPAMDINGFSDCYCILCCEHEYARTSTIDKNLNPYWGEIFSFGIDNIKEALLKIYILDQDLLTNDDPIGIVEIGKLNEIPESGLYEWYDVQPIIGGVVTGDILLQITRFEDSLEISLLEARNLVAADFTGKSDPYVVFKVGKQKKKSSIIKQTLSPTYNENFEFSLKHKETTVYIEVYDWDFLKSDDFLGCLTIDFSEFPLGEPVEAFYLLETDKSKEDIEKIKLKNSRKPENLGQLRVKLELVTQEVHPLIMYTSLLNIILKQSEVIFLVQQHVLNLAAFSEALVKIYDVNALAVKLLNFLSNNEIENTKDPTIIFRSNSITTKSIDYFMRTTGREYSAAVLSPFLSALCQSKKSKSYEVDPTRPNYSSKNIEKLSTLATKLLDRIFQSVPECPEPIKVVLYDIRSKVEATYPPGIVEETKYTALSAFIFLRFFCPAIINPKLFDFVSKMSPTVTRTCLLLAKIIQNTANLAFFGEKERYMIELNNVITDNLDKMKKFLDELCEEGRQFRVSKKHNKTIQKDIWLEKEIARMAHYLLECRENWYTDKDPLSVKLSKELDHIKELDKHE